MTACPKLVDVEAAHDGRLDERARAAVAQHQRDCACCRSRADQLAGLGALLAALPAPPRDTLAARRQQNRLLAAFGAARAVRASSPHRWRGALALTGVAAAAAIAVTVHLVATDVDPPRPAAASTASAVTVVATRARWSRHDEGALTLVRLEDGELDLHVEHGAAPHHLIVSLPDGELEDLGTVFQVRVEAGRTVAVVVREGAVVMRRAGRPSVFLVAGDRWPPEPPPVAAAPPAPVAPVAPPPPHAIRVPAGSAAAAEFRAAVALLDAGRNAPAVAALRAFVAHHPDDRRAEDASYLLVLALQRTGDAAATRDAAGAYLQRYPAGFRRAQVQAVRDAP
jgi:hypothetical protein